MHNPLSRILLALLLLAYFPIAAASPWADPGDMQLRSDLQLLNDVGLINIPMTTWPLSWGDISRAVAGIVEGDDDSPQVYSALYRVKRRVGRESRINRIHGNFGLSYSHNPQLIRTFEDVPTEEGEAKLGIDWMGKRFAARLQVSAVTEEYQDESIWLDGSYLGAALGNWMVSIGAQDRWWGPGWDGSLILGTNARPVPAITLQRNNTTAPDIRWLKWLGPWQFTTFIGQMEEERHVPHARLWGARFTFKPFKSLELGLSRSAQWGGEGRPEDLSTFWNLLLGRDNGPNEGEPGGVEEPGNQLGGYDLRWSLPYNIPVAFYGQLIGEDESSGLPTAKMYLFGLENWGILMGGSYRLHLEYTDTATHRLSLKSPGWNTAYNHHIYQSGYRYYGRSMGHSMDNDGRMWSLGGLYSLSPASSWNLNLIKADLNRDGEGNNNTVSPGKALTLYQVNLSNRYQWHRHHFHWGIGWESLEEVETGQQSDDTSLYVRWEIKL